MNYQVFFDSKLIESYSRSGPHYAIYPPITEYSEQFGQKNYYLWVSESNAELIPRPLALFFHVPFSGAASFHSAGNNVISTAKHRLLEYLKYLQIEIELQGRLFDKDRIVRQLYWGGGVPAFLEDTKVRALIQCIGQHFPLLDDDSGEYTIEIDPHTTANQTISLLRDAGFNHLKLLVPNHEEIVRTSTKMEQCGDRACSMIEAARRADYKTISTDLFYGLPAQSLGDLATTMDALLSHAPDRIRLRNYTHRPDRLSSAKSSLLDMASAGTENIEMLQYAFKKLIDANYVYIGLDQFTRPMDSLAIAQRNGALNRNIQGYSGQKECDLVAMGISAISKIGNHYCQNTSDPAIYRNMLRKGRLPIFRGYFSSREDRIRRHIIQQLICYAKIDIRSVERQWLLKFNHFFAKELEALRAMARDNLINMTDVEIQVSDAGRLLIRNICMVFDQYTKTPCKQDRCSHSIRAEPDAKLTILPDL